MMSVFAYRAAGKDGNVTHVANGVTRAKGGIDGVGIRLEDTELQPFMRRE